jgi:phi13 family phage major tail protein
MALIGLSNFAYAIMTKDDNTGVTYNTPVVVPGVTEINIKPKTETATLYADDGPYDTASSLGDIEVEISLAELDLATQAALLGHTVSNGVMVRKSTDAAPYVAIGFKSLKSNGKYRYVWLLKGKFVVPDQDHKTKQDKPDFQVPKITGTFVKRTYDNAWQKIGDEDATGWTAATGTGWFTSVQ